MKTALIVNFTGNIYHYGCYGTSYEIYFRLLEMGFSVNYLSVASTHSLAVFPDSSDKFSDQAFVNQFVTHNAPIINAIEEADIVVVNGEGTLHRISKGSITLLFIIYLAASLMKKDVYLINHSCYPLGDISRGKEDLLYKMALSQVKDVVIREPMSALFYRALELAFRQGFDSLPLYIRRRGMLQLRREITASVDILLCGGVSFSSDCVAKVASSIKEVHQKQEVKFLMGAKSKISREDYKTVEEFRSHGLNLELIEAVDFEQWCQTIAAARLLMSARFHYSIAAMAMGVPCISFPSNTPKVQGVHAMCDQEGYLDWFDQEFNTKLTRLIVRGMDGDLVLDEKSRISMLELGEQNYSHIDI